MDLLETFLEVASPHVYETLSALDIHRLGDVHWRLHNAVQERTRRHREQSLRATLHPPSLSSRQKQRCEQRLRHATQVLGTWTYEPVVRECVQFHKDCFRRLVALQGRAKAISPEAFKLAWPEGRAGVTHIGPGCSRTIVKHDGIQTTLTVAGVYVCITSDTSDTYARSGEGHSGHVAHWDLTTGPPVESLNGTLELAMALADLFDVSRIGCSWKQDADNLHVFAKQWYIGRHLTPDSQQPLINL